MEQKEASYRGLAFVISPRLLNHINSYKYISHWVSILDFTLPTRSGPQLKCLLINAHGPTSERAAQGPTLLDNFYAEITFVMRTPARWKLFICGNFNSKPKMLRLGLIPTWAHTAWARTTQTVIHFSTSYQPTASLQATQLSNTKHRTTWTGHISDNKIATCSEVTKAVFN